MDHNFALFNVFCICLLSLDLKNRLAASVVPTGRTRTRVKEICRKEVILKASHWWISNTKVTKVLSLGLVYFRSFWYVAVFWWFLCIYMKRERVHKKKKTKERKTDFAPWVITWVTKSDWWAYVALFLFIFWIEFVFYFSFTNRTFFLGC